MPYPEQHLRLLRVLSKIWESEAATVAAIRAGWPDASDIRYRRSLDQVRDFASWRSGDTRFLAVTGIETTLDIAAVIAFFADTINVVHGIETSRLIWATGGEAVALEASWPRGSRVVLAGHSYGGALVCVLGALRAARGFADRTTVVTFGMPRPGNQVLADYLAQCDVTNYAVENDPVIRLPPAGLAGYADVPATYLPSSPYLVGDVRNHYITAYLGEMERPPTVAVPSPERTTAMPLSVFSQQVFNEWKTFEMAHLQSLLHGDFGYALNFNRDTSINSLRERLRRCTDWDQAQRALAPMPYEDVSFQYGNSLIQFKRRADSQNAADVQSEADAAGRALRARVEADIRHDPYTRIFALERRVDALEGRGQSIAPPSSQWQPGESEGTSGDWGGAAEPAQLGNLPPEARSMMDSGLVPALPVSRPITADTSDIRMFAFEGSYIVTVGSTVVYVSTAESAAQNQFGRWRQSLRNGQLAQQLADTQAFADFPFEVRNGTIVRKN